MRGLKDLLFISNYLKIEKTLKEIDRSLHLMRKCILKG